MNKITLYVAEVPVGVGITVRFRLDQNIKQTGWVEYIYIGHTQEDIDQVGVDPVLGFSIKTSLLKLLRLFGVEGVPQGNVITTGKIEHKGDLQFFNSTKGDDIYITNLDANAYRCQVKISIRDKELEDKK